MLEAIKEAEKAFELDEVPVGAIIVKGNEIISRAYNRKETDNISTRHAEMIAIESACIKLNSWRLDGCILYTTLEPCRMCTEVIKESKIKKVIYCAKNQNNNTDFIQIDNKQVIDFCEQLIKKKFDELRIK